MCNNLDTNKNKPTCLPRFIWGTVESFKPKELIFFICIYFRGIFKNQTVARATPPIGVGPPLLIVVFFVYCLTIIDKFVNIVLNFFLKDRNE